MKGPGSSRIELRMSLGAEDEGTGVARVLPSGSPSTSHVNLRLKRGSQCITVWTYLIPLNFTLKNDPNDNFDVIILYHNPEEKLPTWTVLWLGHEHRSSCVGGLVPNVVGELSRHRILWEVIRSLVIALED
jgi:hypothetical protein